MNLRTIQTTDGLELELKTNKITVREGLMTKQFERDENGDLIFPHSITSDIATHHLDQIRDIMMNMMRYRRKSYDSKELIDLLIDSLPENLYEIYRK